MRAIGKTIHNAGWTVEAIQFPGLGSDIPTMFTRTDEDWKQVAREALAKLNQKHSPVLLVGYSFGAAVSLHVAAEDPTAADALMLFAPFWRIGTWWQRPVWEVVRRLYPTFRPFEKIDPADPRLSEVFKNFLGVKNYQDPAFVAYLRSIEVPSKFVDHFFRFGMEAGLAAKHVRNPTFVFQGTEDELVQPKRTHELLHSLAGPTSYYEFPVDHDIVKGGHDSWSAIDQTVTQILQCLTR
jgi:carboxylesterase